MKFPLKIYWFLVIFLPVFDSSFISIIVESFKSETLFLFFKQFPIHVVVVYFLTIESRREI